MKAAALLVLAGCGAAPPGVREYVSGGCQIEAPAGWVPGPLNDPWESCYFELRPPDQPDGDVLLMVDSAQLDATDRHFGARALFLLRGPGDPDAVDEPVPAADGVHCVIRRRAGATVGPPYEVACIDAESTGGAHLRATEAWAAAHDPVAIAARAAASWSARPR